MNWVTFTRRTDDPKLAYLEERLTEASIPHRRNGESFHAPILEVPEEHLDRATDMLSDPYDVDDALVPFDEIEDDDPLFRLANGGAPHAPHDFDGVWRSDDPAPGIGRRPLSPFSQMEEEDFEDEDDTL